MLPGISTGPRGIFHFLIGTLLLCGTLAYIEEVIESSTNGFHVGDIEHDVSTNQIIFQLTLSVSANTIPVIFMSKENWSVEVPDSDDPQKHPCGSGLYANDNICCVNALVEQYQVSPSMKSMKDNPGICPFSTETASWQKNYTMVSAENQELKVHTATKTPGGLDFLSTGSVEVQYNESTSTFTPSTEVDADGNITGNGTTTLSIVTRYMDVFSYPDGVSYKVLSSQNDMFTIEIRLDQSYVSPRARKTIVGGGSRGMAKYEFYVGVTFITLMPFSAGVSINTAQVTFEYYKSEFIFLSISTEQAATPVQQLDMVIHQGISDVNKYLYQYIEFGLTYDRARYPGRPRIDPTSLRWLKAPTSQGTSPASWTYPCVAEQGTYFQAGKAALDLFSQQTCLPRQPSFCAFNLDNNFFMPFPSEFATSTSGFLSQSDSVDNLYVRFTLVLTDQAGAFHESTISTSVDISGWPVLEHCQDTEFVYKSIGEAVKITATLGVKNANISSIALEQTKTGNRNINEIVANPAPAPARRLLSSADEIATNTSFHRPSRRLLASLSDTASGSCGGSQLNDDFIDILRTKTPKSVFTFSDYVEGNLRTQNSGEENTAAILTPLDAIVVNPAISDCYISYDKRYCNPVINTVFKTIWSDITEFSATLTTSDHAYNNGVSKVTWSSHAEGKVNKPYQLVGSFISSDQQSLWYMNDYQREWAIQFFPGSYSYSTGKYEVPSATTPPDMKPATLNGEYFGETFTFTSPTCFTMTRSWMMPPISNYNRMFSSAGLYEIYGRKLPTDQWTTLYQQKTKGNVENNVYIDIGDECYFEYGFTVSQVYGINQNHNRQLSMKKWQVYGQYRRPSMPNFRWKPPKIFIDPVPALNAANRITSLFVPGGGKMAYPALGPVFTICRSFRPVNEATNADGGWTVECYTNGRTDSSAYISDQKNIGSGTAVDLYAMDPKFEFYLHSVWTWHSELSSVEMKKITGGLRKEIGGTPYGESVPVKHITDARAYCMRKIVTLRPLFIMNLFSQFDGVSVPDLGKSGTHSVTLTSGTASLRTEAGKGATNKITSVYGEANAKFFWEGGVSIPLVSTTCWVDRTDGRNPQNRVGQVLTDSTTKYSWGHGGEWYWGYLFHQDSATSNQQFLGSNPKGGGNPNAVTPRSGGPTADDWKIMCAASTSAAPNNIVIDQKPIGYMGGLRSAVYLRIGYSGSVWSNLQKFGFHSLYVWDTVLLPRQLLEVTDAIRAQLGGTREFETIPVLASSTEDNAFCTRCPEGFGSNAETGVCDECGPGEKSTKSGKCGQQITKKARSSMRLPMSKAQFTPARQKQFIASVAAVANVRQSQVEIVSISEVITGRRLLAESINVVTVITAEEGTALTNIDTVLTSDTLNAYIEASPAIELPPIDVAPLDLTTVIEEIAVVDFKGASSYAEAAISLEFDAITFMGTDYAQGYTYRIDNLLILNFLGVSDTHYTRIRNQISDGTGFLIEKELGLPFYKITPDFGEGVLCPEVGDKSGIDTGHMKCFWRSAIVDNKVQKFAEESLYFYRNERPGDAEDAKLWIRDTILGGGSFFSTSTASDYFENTCKRRKEPDSEARSYGCLYIDPGYRWTSRLQGRPGGPVSPFTISDKTIVVAVITVANDEGVVVRRRLLSTDTTATESFDIDHTDGGVTLHPRNSRALLKSDAMVDLENDLGTSVVQSVNRDVYPSFNLAYLMGLKTQKWQNMDIGCMHLASIKLETFAGNCKQALVKMGDSMGPLVKKVHTVGFEGDSVFAGNGRNLLQAIDEYSHVNISTILEMGDEFGGIFVDQIQCVLLHLANETSVLTTQEIDQIISGCKSGSITLAQRKLIEVKLSTCSSDMDSMRQVECNQMRGILSAMPGLAPMDTSLMTEEKAALYFSMELSNPMKEITVDSMVVDTLRHNIAEVFEISVDRVAIEFKNASSTALRRLLAGDRGTQVQVWLYKDKRSDYQNAIFNKINDGDVTSKYDTYWKGLLVDVVGRIPVIQFLSISPSKSNVVKEVGSQLHPWVIIVNLDVWLPGMTNLQKQVIVSNMRDTLVNDLDLAYGLTTSDISLVNMITTALHTNYVMWVRFSTREAATKALGIMQSAAEELRLQGMLTRRMQNEMDDELRLLQMSQFSVNVYTSMYDSHGIPLRQVQSDGNILMGVVACILIFITFSLAAYWFWYPNDYEKVRQDLPNVKI